MLVRGSWLALGVGFMLSTSAMVEQVPTDRVIYKKHTVIDFGPSEIDGSAVQPTGTTITEPPRPNFRRLLKLRTDFRAELLSSGGSL